MSALPTVELAPGLHTRVLGFGAMALTSAYGGIGDDEALATLHAALDAGIDMIDTADGYGGGDNERLIARVLSERRDEVVIATKVGIVGNSLRSRTGTAEVDNSPAYVHRAARASLERLGTDSLDLLYLHRRDERVPIEEAVGAMAELVEQGLVRHLGLSEVTATELRAAVATHPIAVVQSEWSVWSRDIEERVIPAAAELGVGVVPYAPLGRGFLAGAVTASAELGENDFRRALPRFSDAARASNEAVGELVRSVAAELSATPAQVSLAWLYASGRRAGVTVVPIPGTRRPERVRENLGALALELAPEQIATLDSAAARTSGARFGDLTWVSQGRE